MAVFNTARQMVYISQPENRTPPSPNARMDFAALLDPTLLQSARQIHRTYFEVHPDEVQRPLGVVIDRTSHRGKLVFNGKPVLLPNECFVPITQIEPSLS